MLVATAGIYNAFTSMKLGPGLKPNSLSFSEFGDVHIEIVKWRSRWLLLKMADLSAHPHATSDRSQQKAKFQGKNFLLYPF